jgi:hypothetical protein
MDVANDVPCILHLHKRVIDKMLSMILLRLRHGEKMSRMINEHVLGLHDDPGTYSVPMDGKSGELWEVKFNDGYAKLVELKLSALLPKLLTKP